MDDPANNFTPDPSQDAVARRLARLRHRPVDVTGLAQRIEAEINRPIARIGLWGRVGPRARMAAGLLLTATVLGVIAWTLTRPAIASAADLSRIHAQNLAGTGTVPVDSIADAQRQLNTRWSGCPMLPDVPNVKVYSCGVHPVGKKQISCAVLNLEGQTVTVAVAFAKELRPPRGKAAVTPDGMRYVVQSEGHAMVVVTMPDDVWVAVIGDLPVERLVSLAGKLRFPATR